MHQHGYIGRKLKQPELRAEPAVVLVTFGTSNRSREPLALFDRALEKRFPDSRVYRACSSAVLRKKLGLPGPQEVLAEVEAAGYRRAVVQPLHIFPGVEYRQLAETCEYFPGLRVFLGETLLHRWLFVREVLPVLEKDFLAPDEGLNLLALHGSPLTADPVNAALLGLDRLVRDRYPNVRTAALEGVPVGEAVLSALRRNGFSRRYSRVRILPLMYFAGLHAERDLMGGEGSWRTQLEDMGFIVECIRVTGADNTKYYKGLAWYPQVLEFFLDRLERILELARCC